MKPDLWALRHMVTKGRKKTGDPGTGVSGTWVLGEASDCQ